MIRFPSKKRSTLWFTQRLDPNLRSYFARTRTSIMLTYAAPPVCQLNSIHIGRVTFYNKDNIPSIFCQSRMSISILKSILLMPRLRVKVESRWPFSTSVIYAVTKLRMKINEQIIHMNIRSLSDVQFPLSMT